MTRKPDVGDGANYAPDARAEQVVAPGEFRFAAAYLDHGHIYGQCNGLIAAGGTLEAVYDPDPARLAAFCERFPQARPVADFRALLDDPGLAMIAAAAVPDERWSVGCEVLEAGKDYFTDKSPFTTLDQLDETRAVAARTGRRYMCYYAERLHNEAAWHAGELIAAGAIGCVLQVLNIAPHRLSADTRPGWFFDKSRYGGIITDIGSHQVEQFLTYAGCSEAAVNYARVANFANPDYPGLEDFGEFSLTGASGASCYARVDWFTPAGSPVWGDGRTFVVGTQGTLEVRKYTDPGRQAPASSVILTDGERVQEIDCLGRVGYPFFGRLILDTLERTESAMSQTHVFAAAEISMRAQCMADASGTHEATP